MKKGKKWRKKGSARKIRTKLRLQTELILWSVGILLVFMGIQQGFTGMLANDIAMREKERQMERLMVELKSKYSDDIMEIFEVAREFQDVENLRIMIFSDERLVYHSASVESAPNREDPWNVPRGSMPEVETEGSLNSENMSEDMGSPNRKEHEYVPLDMIEVLEQNVVTLEETFQYNGENRTIMIWSSVMAIDSAVNLFVQVNLGVSVMVIVMAVFGVVVFSRRFTQPIINMENVAEAVANLDFSNKVDGNIRTRELTHLAMSINVMSDNLKEMIDQLNEDKANLSTKVENQEKLEQMRRQFVANISHEMKTPLSMLMMYSESLKSDIPGMDKTFYYDTIIQEASGLNTMVEQLLDASAVENGLSTMDLQPLYLSRYTSEFLERMHPMLNDYQVEVQMEEGLYVRGDLKYIEQALRNFVTNAMSHTEKGKKIKIVLEQFQGEEGESWVRYAVENEGNLISEGDLPYLWDSFYRGDKSRTQSQEGNSGKRVGLGLYIVKTCITSHLGHVFAKNKESGVEFSFLIPLLNLQTLTEEEREYLRELEEF